MRYSTRTRYGLRFLSYLGTIYHTKGPSHFTQLGEVAGAEEISCRAKLEDMGGVRVKGSEWFIVSHAVYQKLYDEGMAVFKPKQKPIHFIEQF